MKASHYLVIGILFLMTAVLTFLSMDFSALPASKGSTISSALFGTAALIYFYNYYTSRKAEKDD